MSYVFHRGEYVLENQAMITKDNRAFLYGDGFFESIRVMNGQALFLEAHFTRIKDTIKALKIIPSPHFSFELFSNQIHGLLHRNEITKGGRVRVTFYRKSEGYYLPKQDDLGYYIEASHFPNNEFIINPAGKVVDIYPDFKKEANKLSMFKTLNCQLFVMAAIYANQKGLDEALIQNNKFSIIESSSSNLFIVSNGVLYTPAIEDGCIAGAMRMNIINIALDNKIKVYECTLNPQNLLTADEIFLTNAIRGIEWVVTYRTKRYYNEMTKKLILLLNQASQKYIADRRI